MFISVPPPPLLNKKTGSYPSLHRSRSPQAFFQIGDQLYRTFPRIFTQNHLKYFWSYKYDERYGAIPVHADDAAINVNFWLTPDDANLDPTSGGLVVYEASAPAHWSFEEFNLPKNMQMLVKDQGHKNRTVAYKQNRIVIFDSQLFHKTDRFSFKKGYTNRRINLTYLYGKRKRSKLQETLYALSS